jgi:hypothetical protein
MILGPEPRRGIASILGMLFMALLFMVAIGAQVYISGLQAQSSQLAAQAGQREAAHSDENLGFTNTPTGLYAANGGPTSETLVAMILKFENGTVYNLNSASTPAFAQVVVPSSYSVAVQGIVPAGTCSPGTSSCLSKYTTLVKGGAVSGRAVGLVTSLGNTFWYAPASSQWDLPASALRTGPTQSTTSTSFVQIQGLSFTASPNAFYEVSISLVYYFQPAANFPNAVTFAISVPPGSTFVACGGADITPTTSGDQWLGNLCVYTADTSLGYTYDPIGAPLVYCDVAASPCQFVEKAYVTFGQSGGTFQLEYKAGSGYTAYVLADSVLEATPFS